MSNLKQDYDIIIHSPFKDIAININNLICSNDVIDCIKEISQFKNVTDSCLVLFVAAIALVLFDTLFLILLLRLFKNRIFIVKNYAYERDKVITYALKKIP